MTGFLFALAVLILYLASLIYVTHSIADAAYEPGDSQFGTDCNGLQNGRRQDNQDGFAKEGVFNVFRSDNCRRVCDMAGDNHAVKVDWCTLERIHLSGGYFCGEDSYVNGQLYFEFSQSNLMYRYERTDRMFDGLPVYQHVKTLRAGEDVKA